MMLLWKNDVGDGGGSSHSEDIIHMVIDRQTRFASQPLVGRLAQQRISLRVHSNAREGSICHIMNKPIVQCEIGALIVFACVARGALFTGVFWMNENKGIKFDNWRNGRRRETKGVSSSVLPSGMGRRCCRVKECLAA